MSVINFPRTLLPGLLACGLALPPAASPAGEARPKGFVSLFNGKDLSGWHGMPHFDPYKLDKLPEAGREKQLAAWTADAKEHWKVEKGELVNDGKGAYLTTDREFGDLELLIEYRTVPKADSGIYLRATPQVQIWDTTKEGGKWDRGADKGSGGLFNNSKGSPGRDPLVLADKPFGQWNRFRILQVGERTTVYLNDKLVVDQARLENFWDRKLPLRRQGPIQLQTHGGEIRWRNIFVREIPAGEANAILSKHGSAGFKSVFNGKDFTGWAGPVANYEVKEGAIVCRPKKGGNIYTEGEYGDFVARVEYRLPPGGNNGLAIRYPGKGQPSRVAMCEVQILDDTAAKYARLDPRQYNGSAYGMVPAHRGYLRPPGEWNFMEVTVRGPAIRVELNGTRILDADLSTVTRFMGDSPHPGKGRTAGHFGFCGHNDPVAFRNIRIKRLDRAEREKLFVAAPLTEENAFTAGIEGPACDARGNVYAVNFARQQTIGKVTPDGKGEVWVTLPGKSTGNGIVFDRKGMMYVADYVGHNVLRVDPATRKVTVFAHDDRMNQPNDLAIAPDGTLYASDPNWGKGTGQVWRIDRDGKTSLVAEKMGTTNGIEVSPDGKTLYVNESVQRNVWAFDVGRDGSLSGKRLLKKFDDHGFDGMRCDVDGNLYVTRHGKGTVAVLSPAGKVLREIDVLGKNPSNLCFGGPDGRTVYVTEVTKRRLVQFRVDRPGLAWQRWQRK